MRTVNFRDEVLYPLAYKAGLDPNANFLADQANAFVTFINSWVRRLYDRFDWPEWTVIEVRTPTNHVVPYVAGGGTTPIGKVYKVYLRDPQLTSGPIDTPFKLSEAGIHCGFQHGTNVWIKFCRPAPKFTVALWINTKAYAVGDVVYNEADGNCYSAIATSTGVALTDNTKWTVVLFPAALSDLVVRGALSDVMRDEGKGDLAQAEEAQTNAQTLEKAAQQVASELDPITDQAGNASRYRAGGKVNLGGGQ